MTMRRLWGVKRDKEKRSDETKDRLIKSMDSRLSDLERRVNRLERRAEVYRAT